MQEALGTTVGDVSERGGLQPSPPGGELLSPHSPYLLTPAARDRARLLGIWRDRP